MVQITMENEKGLGRSKSHQRIISFSGFPILEERFNSNFQPFLSGALQSPKLRYAEVPIISNTQCKHWSIYGNWILSSNICAG